MEQKAGSQHRQPLHAAGGELGSSLGAGKVGPEFSLPQSWSPTVTTSGDSLKLRCDQVQSTTLGISSLSSRGKIISLACLSRLLSVIQLAFPASSSSCSPCLHSTFGLTTGLSSETRSQGRAGWGRPRPAALERPGLPREPAGDGPEAPPGSSPRTIQKGGSSFEPRDQDGGGARQHGKSRVRRSRAGTPLRKDCCRSRMPAIASLPAEADPATPGPQLGHPWAPRPSEVTALALCLCLCFSVSWLILAGPAGPCYPRSTRQVPPRCPAGECSPLSQRVCRADLPSPSPSLFDSGKHRCTGQTVISCVLRQIISISRTLTITGACGWTW